VTTRLYHDDAYLRSWQARVTAVTGNGVILDRTAFYPEAGGQLGDRGTIGGVAVVDTQESDDGIVHILDGALPAVETTVACELDWARRRQHMAQHTAQHLLSGALLDRAAAPTQSARLGESALTIDVGRDRIPEADLAAAEDLANDLVDDDLAIRAWFPTAAELADLKLRRDPKVAADIRVVAIGDFDYSPCGGTHCARTSQLGAVRIVGAERYKGMTRVTFVAARRGRAEMFTRDQVLRGLATTFSCGPNEVPAAVDKLRRDGGTADAEITALRGRLAKLIVAELLAKSTGPIVAALPGDSELLRTIGAHITAAGRDAILCAPDDAGTSVVLFRATGSQLDCGALWKKLAVAGGRGGGRADRAEGKLTTRVDDWPAAVAAALT
jgi:alanyl-tRNA synthetase